MPVNTILQALMQGFEERRQREEDELRKQMALENLALQQKQLGLGRAQEDRALALAIENVKQKGIENVAGGLVPIQGFDTGVPQRVSGTSMQPWTPEEGGATLYPAEGQYQGPEFQPFRQQIAKTAFGDIPFEAVSFPERIKQQLQMRELSDLLDIQKAGQTAEVQERARVPNLLLGSQLRRGEQELAGERTVKLHEADAAQAMLRTLAQGKNSLAVARLNAESRMAVAKWRTAHPTSTLIDPDTLTANAYLASVGKGDVKGFGNAAMATKRFLVDNNLKPFNESEGKKLGGIQGLKAVSDRIITEIIPLLSKTEIGAIGTGVSRKAWPGELKNKFDQLMLDATMSAREAGEKGNFSNTDIGRAMAALASPFTTQDQARDRVKTLNDKIQNRLFKDVLGGLSNRQKLLILQEYQIDPSTYNLPLMKDSTGRQRYLFEQHQDEWTSFNDKTKAWESID